MITSATYRSSSLVGTSQALVVLRLVDSILGTSDRTFTASGDTLQELQDDLSRQIANLNVQESRKNVLAGVTVGANIPVTAPVVAAPTAPQVAKELWFTKMRRLIRMHELINTGIVSATLSADFEALKADVAATYLTGYATEMN